MTKKLEYVEIYPKIIVYRNVFDNPDLFLEKSLMCEGWEDWYTFGTMLSLQESPISFTSFPTKEEYVSARAWDMQDENSVLRGELCKELGEIFFDVTNDYILKYPEESLPNWIKNSASVNKYTDGAGISEHYAMNYHTDFIQPLEHNPGIKFGITTTFYLNDEYQDGQICFKINDEYVSHKPKKGDVIVFPSMHPYYHAVRKNSGNDRYMIRSFWQFQHDGSQEWLDNEKKYGAETWEEMEKERYKTEKFNGQFQAEELHQFFGRDNGKYL
jgi:hypothetical protein